MLHVYKVYTHIEIEKRERKEEKKNHNGVSYLLRIGAVLCIIQNSIDNCRSTVNKLYRKFTIIMDKLLNNNRSYH